MELRKDRVGEIVVINNIPCKIIQYVNANHIIVEFQDEYKTTVCTNYSRFVQGSIKNPFCKSVCGIGYIGNTCVSINGKKKDSYRAWDRMIRRCYGDNPNYKNSTYKDCTVCEEWLCYANFEKWYDENYYEIDGERTELDKDILLKGNKVYSPITCVFVPKNINALFEKSNKIRNSFYIGVRQHSKYKNKYMAECSDGHNKNKYLGIFDNPKEAFYAYKTHKENLIKEIAEKYKESIPNKLYEAMFNYKVEMTD